MASLWAVMNVALHPAFIEFCAGAGQLGEGVRGAVPDARCVLYVENEVSAAGLLVARIADGSLDDAPIWSDARGFDGEPWRGRVGGIIGGYPCQPFSYAGKRRGVDDPRHLWPVIERHIRCIGPQWCFFENVAGHLRLGYHDVVRPDLERLGYRVTEGLWKASDAGASHSRQRLFIFARRVADPDWPDVHLKEASRRDGARAVAASAGGAMADAADERHERGGAARGRRAGLADGIGELGYPNDARLEGRRPNGGRGDELPAWPPGPEDADAWGRVLAVRPDLAPAQPFVRGVADGLARGMDLTRADRLRILGNGVVPQQATIAFRVLADRLGVEL